MFTNVRYFVKTSIVFMLAGILSGLFMLLCRRVFEIGYGPSLLSAHTHVILVGFMMMMIMGISIWFFPRAEKTDKRYNPSLVISVYWLMLTGTSFRFIAEFIDAFISLQIINIVIVISSILQIFAAIIFVYTIWGRVRPVGSQIREAKGERF